MSMIGNTSSNQLLTGTNPSPLGLQPPRAPFPSFDKNQLGSGDSFLPAIQQAFLIDFIKDDILSESNF